MIPELKFSPANLKRHLAAENLSFGRRVIYTTRDKKGKYGQVYYIEGAGYFTYTDYDILGDRLRLVERYWRREGFKSPEEFYRELCEIYPDSQKLCVGIGGSVRHRREQETEEKDLSENHREVLDMTDALTLFEAKALDTFSEEDIRTLKRQLHCEACSHDEWRMLELMSTAYGLSPFLRQIWAVPKIGVFVGHGGFLTIAHRSGRFAGMDTQSYNADGTEYRGGGHPAYSVCRVWLKDAAEPVTKRVFWEEFGEQRTGSQGKKTNWDKMPAYMLEKVAEVHALKRAFSISGVYCPEEMGYDEEEIIPPASVDGEPVEVTRLSKTDSSRPNPETWTVTTSHTDAETCPECGKPSMPELERFQVQTGFDNARFGTVPAGLCKECATKLYRELLKKEGQ